MKYAIFAGLSGGFGGAIFQYVDDFDKCFAELLASYHIGNKVVCYGTTMEGFECEQL